MSETVDFWRGDFGSEYLARNRVQWRDRVPFWRRIIETTGATSVLDVGCNAGWNLLALREVNPELMMSGVDVNQQALKEAAGHGFDVMESPADKIHELFAPGSCDLAVTSGVLIHIAPEDLRAAMQAIVDVSSQYVLAIEYDSGEEREIDYRGNTGKLWARPFGRLYEELGLSLVEHGTAEGFDQCTYFLLSKD
jgi:pseudaminic acid biosynthesis-associated methylase